MKIVIINGSARKGNTLTAINAFIKGADEKNEIEVIAPDKLHISPCKGCGACQCHKGCVDQDDTCRCNRADRCVTVEVWRDIQAAVSSVVDRLTLADLVRRYHEKCSGHNV